MIAKPLVTVSVINSSMSEKENLPVSFGLPLVQADVGSLESLKVMDESNQSLPVQFTTKTRWVDGSHKHGVVSLIVPNLAANSETTLSFYHDDNAFASGESLTMAEYAVLGHDIKITLHDSVDSYTASINQNINHSDVRVWQQGSICSEWIIPAALETSGGSGHSQLKAYFHLQLYSSNDIKVSVIIENTHSFYEEKAVSDPFSNTPMNVTYDWTVSNGTDEIDSGTDLEHFAHSRWRKVYSTFSATPGTLQEDALDVHPVVDKAYLIRSKAIASYDINGDADEALLNKINNELLASDTAPMGIGMIDPIFSSGVEGSIDAAWSVDYLLSGDNRAYKAMIKNAEAAASIGIHFRDERADSPNQRSGEILSIIDQPQATIRDDSETIPFFDGDKYFDEKSGLFKDIHPDTAHQNSFAYLPYLTTGDYYFLEELHFWANRNVLALNPGSGARNGAEGLIKPNTVRGQAWAMRTLANAAFITPDDHINKNYFETLLNSNIQWYIDSYTGSTPQYTNIFGTITYGFNENTGISYQNSTGSQAWMDNWFTAVSNRIFQMGYADIEPLLLYKVQTPVALLTHPNYCYVFASTYAIFLRDGVNQPLYSDWATVYQTTIEHDYNQAGEAQDIIDAACGSQNMADLINNTGKFGADYAAGQILYTLNVSGSYFGRLQGAVAAAADSGVAGGQQAWDILMASNGLPDYSVYSKKSSFDNGNKYNIVPYAKNFPD